MELYPLRFKEIIRTYPFGGKRIKSYFPKKPLPDLDLIAESWEVCDRPAESSEIINGEFAGKTLNWAIHKFKEELLGKKVFSQTGLRFPLLCKFLDASNELDEQVHHSDKLAESAKINDTGKTEAWYIIDTDSEASICCGLQPGTAYKQALTALKAGKIKTLMNETPVKSGDSFLLQAGTAHYSKGGFLMFEIMQNSDSYVSLKDIPDDPAAPPAEERLKVVDFSINHNCRIPHIKSKYFELEKKNIDKTCSLYPDGSRFYIFSLIEGQLKIETDNYSDLLNPGNTVLIPATVQKISLSPLKNSAAGLLVNVP